MILTIAIPTYARNDILHDNLVHLLPQLDRSCKLLIIDNNSPIPVSDTLSDAIDQSKSANVKIIRNHANIGANANILRCIEECDTEWLWILSDDDRVLPDAVTTSLEHIKSYRDCLFINFHSDSPSHPPRYGTILTTGSEGFARNIDSYGAVLFLSSGLYRVAPLLQNLRYGYHFQGSCAPMLAVLLASLGEDGQCCLSSDQIVVNLGSQTTPLEQQGSPVGIALGIATILDLPILSSAARSALSQKIAALTDTWLTPRGVFHQIILLHQRDGDLLRWTYLFDVICHRLFRLRKTPKQMIEVHIYRSMLRFPKISYHLLSWVLWRSRRERTGTHKIGNITRL